MLIMGATNLLMDNEVLQNCRSKIILRAKKIYRKGVFEISLIILYQLLLTENRVQCEIISFITYPIS